jgi:O-methyltransferase
MKSSANLYLADTFKGVAMATEADQFYQGGEHADTSLEKAQEIVNTTGYKNVFFLQGIFPGETAHFVGNEEKFGLVHIDVDVYEGAKAITEWVWPRLVKGGVLVFDDYGFHTTGGVTRYVNSLWNQPDLIIIHNINGHAVIIKL